MRALLDASLVDTSLLDTSLIDTSLIDADSAQCVVDGLCDEGIHGAACRRRTRHGVNLQATSLFLGQDVPMDLRDSRVLVSGGTSGVGLALVELLVARGARVVTCGRDQARCSDIRARFADVHVIETDLSERGRSWDLVEESARHLGGLDVVICNAAVQVMENYVQIDRASFEGTVVPEIAANFSAPVEITAAAMPWLTQSTDAIVVYVTSGLAVFPKKTAPVYCATKSALRTFAAAVRYQVEDGAPHVKILDAVLPLVDTPMTAGRGNASEKMTPESVARRILSAIESPRPVTFIGKARLVPWLTRLAPSVGRRALRNS